MPLKMNDKNPNQLVTVPADEIRSAEYSEGFWPDALPDAHQQTLLAGLHPL